MARDRQNRIGTGPSSGGGRRALLLYGLILLAPTACTPGTPQPPPPTAARIAIQQPSDGQTLAGTAGLAAIAIGGTPGGLAFTIDGRTLPAGTDGTAALDTRNLADGNYSLTASALIAGRQVTSSVNVAIANTLPSTGQVGASGGALKTGAGSIAMIPPGTFDSTVTLTVGDLSQQQILDRYAIDYEALGVTFLGAMDIQSNPIDSANNPLQVDLAGWSQGVQPNHQVLMFALAPDLDGNGSGELMFAADAVAVEGSVITTPKPGPDALGFPTAGSLRLQQTTGATPGEIVTITATGFWQDAPLSTVATFDTGAEVLAHVTSTDPGSPLLTVRVAIPALSSGSHALALSNLSLGYYSVPGRVESTPLTLTVAAPGSPSQATWDAFVTQVATALDNVAGGRPRLASQARPWLETLGASNDPTAQAMARNSNLVSSANQAALETITGDTYTSGQRDLVARHALVLDAIAVSVPDLAQPAADLATVLVLSDPTTTPPPQEEARIDGMAQRRLRAFRAALQDDLHPQQSCPIGGQCFGPTGMGSAPPPGNNVRSNIAGPQPGPRVDTSDVGAARAGTLRPAQGVIVSVFVPGSANLLSPFTAITDHAGYYDIPFVVDGEPFTLVALDPATGNTAVATGVGGPYEDPPISIPLILSPPGDTGPGTPIASFTITPLPGDFPGSYHYRLDAGGSTDPDGSVALYRWSIGGSDQVAVGEIFELFLPRNGTHDISLTIVDDDGNTDTTTRTLAIDDLPYDYWGLPPDRITEAGDGTPADRNGFIEWVGLSRDGRHAIFQSNATNLAPDVGNGRFNVYLKDLLTGAIELLNDGTADAEHGDGGLSISDDARYVAYTSQVVNPNNTRQPSIIHVVDRLTDTIQAVGPEGGLQEALQPSLSADGRTLAFEASSFNGGFPTAAIFVKDLETGIVALASRTTGGAQSQRAQLPRLSGDGRYVVFQSLDSDLVENDTNDAEDVFVTDLETGVTERVSTAADGSEGNGRSSWASISDDGRFVAFMSLASNLVENDTNGEGDVFVKDRQTGATQRLSINVLGQQGNEWSGLPSISGDGRFVAFGSYAGNLVPLPLDLLICCGDTTPGFSYVADVQTGHVALVSVGYDGISPPNDFDSVEPFFGRDGLYLAFFADASNLVPDDSNEDYDFFRARNPFRQTP